MAGGTNLLISASFAASGEYAQVSRDISDQLESSSQKPLSLLSAALLLDGEGTGGSSLLSSLAAKDTFDFEPRFREVDDDDDDDDSDHLFAPRLEALSPSSSSALSSQSSSSVSSSSQVTTASPPQHATDDSLVQCFSNIQIVSPRFFQERQLASFGQNKTPRTAETPEALISKGCYTTATARTSRSSSSSLSSKSSSTHFLAAASSASTASSFSPSKRQLLAEMVHSVDLSLFPKPLQRLGESPVLARIGSLLHPPEQNRNSSPRSPNNTTMNESFHTCHMTEESFFAASNATATMHPTQPLRPYGHSPTRKRKSLDGAPANDAPNAAMASAAAPSSLLSPEDVGATARARSRTSSSFQSSRHPHRVIYRLKEGRKGMSQQSKETLNSLLPRLFNLGRKSDKATPSNKHSYANHRKQSTSSSATPKAKNPPQQHLAAVAPPPAPHKIYVLLLEIPNKLFEICPVDYVRDMTVGDVLTKVRTHASDPVLAAQSYRGLLNADTEFSAPMLPVSLLLDPTSSNTNSKHLLTALPLGASSNECRRIRQMLMGHPTLQKFWEKDDPFEPSPAKRQRRH